MKKLILFSTLIMLGVATVSAQSAKRFATFEHFTQASCGPCADQNPAFQSFFSQNTSNAHHIAYHTSWPGTDPMYNENPADVDSRVDYYGVSGVPTIIVSGLEQTNPNSVDGATLEGVAIAGSPIQVLVENSIDGMSGSASITINAINDLPEGNYSLQTVVVEQMIEYSSPPGSNGERDFPNVMRQMLPNVSGTTVNSMEAGASASYDFDYMMEDVWNADEIYVLAFLQNEDTKEIVNSGSSMDWKVNYVSLGEATTQVSGSQNIMFDGNVSVNLPDAQFLQIEVISDAPADWISSINYFGTDLGLNAATLEFVNGDITGLGLNIITSETVSFATYTLKISDANDPSLSTQQTYYVNNGITDLVLGNTSEWNDLYGAGLTYGGNSKFGSLGKGSFLYAKKANILEGLNNIYYNVAWTFPPFTDDVVAELTSFLDNGGNLLIAGQDIGWATFDPSSTYSTANTQAFYSDYLQAEYIGDGDGENATLSPVITDDTYGFGLIESSAVVDMYDGNMWPDQITPNSATATPIFTYNDDASNVAGIKSDNGTFKVVYLGIGIEMIGDEAVRNEFMKLTHDWFYDGLIDGIDYTTALQQIMQQNYPNPANQTTRIAFDNLNENATFTLTDLNGKVVLTQAIEAGNNGLNLNTQNISAGTYLYQLTNEKGTAVATKKMTIVH
ncbi:MAG: Omp28-related outer membrane protein [Chitinophagales bacterium]